MSSRLFTVLLLACGGSQTSVEAPAPVAAQNTEPVEVDVGALLGEDNEGSTHFDHGQLNTADARGVAAQVLQQILAVLETEVDAEALHELAARVSQSRIVWRYSDDHAPVLTTTAFEVTDVDGLDALLARVLPEAEPLTTLDGLMTGAGAIARADGGTFLVGNLSDIREMLDVATPIEVTWPSEAPVITGWFASNVLDDTLTTLATAAVALQRADFRVSFEDDVAAVHIDMATSTPETLTNAVRVAIDRFTQLLTENRNNFVMRVMLRALDLETLFDNVQLETTEDAVTFTMSLSVRQAKTFVDYAFGIFGRALRTE